MGYGTVGENLISIKIKTTSSLEDQITGKSLFQIPPRTSFYSRLSQVLHSKLSSTKRDNHTQTTQHLKMAPSTTFTATYTNSSSLSPSAPFTLTKNVPTTSTSTSSSPMSTSDRAKYLHSLRQIAATFQDDINRELTQRMEEDNKRAAAASGGKSKAEEKAAKEEENYGEEVVEEDE
ncbi:hypothetical protein SMACR_02301 [Sordaria macrospora]|nr:hypothetical protein SMACR_02301 [Sordaria macrospora]KAH7626841.1 Gon7 family-domain-containing protein [Sordaria sp. MPI-SDFR-AT-0083]WPJ64681.1 hypothetical protein SMAC4_02301 [Sordaria macrospora]